ncbi:hypothetical protein Ahy_B10g103338 isoform B [Arachis hypogaea]|uniref:Uncharacterized protein n=1 Tax=Arachis hypogaea TaxID=3818 RepID=A0A444X3J1_ARAHY|nr:hypothetical protein Ahy_B10g103338 isoform B [Arachis hypogaea]
MTDELSNVNGGSSTNDSIPISMQQADVSSRSEGAIGTEKRIMFKTHSIPSILVIIMWAILRMLRI